MTMVERQWTWCPSLLYCSLDDFSLASRGKTAVLTLTSAPPSPAKMVAPANTMSTHTGKGTLPVHKSACCLLFYFSTCFLVPVTLCSNPQKRDFYGPLVICPVRGSAVLCVFLYLCVQVHLPAWERGALLVHCVFPDLFVQVHLPARVRGALLVHCVFPDLFVQVHLPARVRGAQLWGEHQRVYGPALS